jgi:two-component system NtrC family sensor kinase
VSPQEKLPRKIKKFGTLILRATINSQHFDSIVATTYLGTSGEAFIINTNGIYQTNSRIKKIIEKSNITIPSKFKGVKHEQVIVNGNNKVRTTSWINNDKWLLVTQQDKNEILVPVRKAMFKGLIVLCVSIFLLIVATSFATHYLTRQIEISSSIISK